MNPVGLKLIYALGLSPATGGVDLVLHEEAHVLTATVFGAPAHVALFERENGVLYFGQAHSDRPEYLTPGKHIVVLAAPRLLQLALVVAIAVVRPYVTNSILWAALTAFQAALAVDFAWNVSSLVWCPPVGVDDDSWGIYYDTRRLGVPVTIDAARVVSVVAAVGLLTFTAVSVWRDLN